jgi:nucleoside-diphosphate-sugar epimerase
VHVEDIAGAFLAALTAPRASVHNQAFNIGQSSENYRVRDLAEMVQDTWKGCRIDYAPGGGPDKRCYRVCCDKAATALPGFRANWTVRRGIEQLIDAYTHNGLTSDDLAGPRFVRLARLRELMAEERLNGDLRWQRQNVLAGAPG